MTTTSDHIPAARSRKALWLGVALGAAVITLFLLGKTGVLGSLEAFIAHMQDMADTPWALPAAVVAFGPVNGALYSWVATMVSGTITFWLGRFSGEAAVARFSGRRTARFADFVSRNAFAASLIVRNVPTGPFLIVNMAFGALRANYLAFLGGMAIGSLPKILLVTFAGQSLISAITGSPLLALGLAALAALIFGGLWLYVHHRQKTGKIISPMGIGSVDTASEKPE